MIEELKSTLAKEKIEQFLESMKQLGYQKEEAVTLITKIGRSELRFHAIESPLSVLLY